jgi:hypothetical protein
MDEYTDVKPKNTTMIIVVAIIAVILLVAIGFAIYGIVRSSSTKEAVPCSSTPCSSCTKSADGIWVSTGSGYNLAGAKEYCTNQGGRLATSKEITDAGQAGTFDTCSKGWFADGTGTDAVSGVGRYNTGTQCGKENETRVNQWVVYSGQTDKQVNGSAYCYSTTIPADRSVATISLNQLL